MGRGERTRLRIQRVALELFVQKGVRETTVRDIAAAAGLAEGALYRHFPSKEALAESLFTENYEALTADLDRILASSDNLRVSLERVVAVFCTAFDRDWALFSYLLLTQHNYLRHRSAEAPSPYNSLRRALGDAMTRGEIPGRDPDLASSMVLGLVLQSALSRVYGRLSGALEDHQEQISAACWQVLALEKS